MKRGDLYRRSAFPLFPSFLLFPLHHPTVNESEELERARQNAPNALNTQNALGLLREKDSSYFLSTFFSFPLSAKTARWVSLRLANESFTPGGYPLIPGRFTTV